MARYKTESCSATCVALRKSEIKVSHWVSDVKSGQDWKCGFGKSGMAVKKKIYEVLAKERLNISFAWCVRQKNFCRSLLHLIFVT